MISTIRKGNLGVAKILADLTEKGFSLSVPLDEGAKYDLIADDSGTLIRIQCKYTESDGEVVVVRPCSHTHVGFKATKREKYTKSNVDYVAVYDATTGICFYIPASELGDGKAELRLRLVSTKNGQKEGIRWAKDYMGL